MWSLETWATVATIVAAVAAVAGIATSVLALLAARSSGRAAADLAEMGAQALRLFGMMVFTQSGEKLDTMLRAQGRATEADDLAALFAEKRFEEYIELSQRLQLEALQAHRAARASAAAKGASPQRKKVRSLPGSQLQQ